MQVMEQLVNAGLDVELDALISKFLVKEGDEEASTELKSAIDEGGLKSPKTMKAIAQFQRAQKLRPGLYKELVGLEEKLDELKTDDNAEGEVEEKASDTVEVTEFSQKEEEKIKERMKKEEEKLRKRLLAKEEKIRERLKLRAENKAKRKGMKLEEIQAIKERKERLAELKAQTKEVREEMKKLRAEIKELRPKKAKKDVEAKAKKGK